MREVRFRFWNVECGYMEDWLDMQDKIDLGEFLNGDWPEYYIPMQYTGLEDRSGVEIYEGDIVVAEHENFYDDRVEVEPEYRPWVGEVKFDNCAYIIDTKGKSDYNPSLNNVRIRSITILGNIYENHGLLEEDN